MNIPKDPAILLSVINTALRDRYPSLDELCASEGVDKADIIDALKKLDYTYDAGQNRFI
ncbi:MAG: DUF4250 domain-containing protein [Lachnospiraceae bacterium]|jgi:hypothetical protein|nr:DUF4250 domain-containing protein [Lachnospiraceae bacterium]MEE3461200.1 DUF4250 domain-containing protein [Lachnospiraceae bacterium]